ncbi:MAG TPA: Uma2 family endonuclease [Acidisphaera sp.]|nr:Uma2 family endonuclease [Acidisphaera sp.]
MNVALRRSMTVAEFLAWEAKQEGRYEFDGIRPRAMTGGTLAHNRIGNNLRRRLDDALEGRQCSAWGPDAKVEVAGKVYYPDAAVTCSPTDGRSYLLPEPVVIIEVLSESTAEIDLGTKSIDYRSLPSLRHYVLVAQTQPTVTVLTLLDDTWVWTSHTSGGTVSLDAIGVTLLVDQLYANVSFPDAAA